ncbi:uncharacterized protein LOC124936212 [Impatiens glandulifera]|uniref:uncharacterized protein LOC124936212 n=1 Tax=Impatiens glandulifera TaxID=253017 RepID=UPI001FB0DF8D|nr:uncharacterized protein LOC124936212 [Impatiens glandulifera]
MSSSDDDSINEIDSPPANPPTGAGAGGSFITFPNLNCLAIIIILTSTGMVNLKDLSFAVFSLIYLYFLSKVAFPTLSSDPNHSPPPVFGETNKILGLYVLAGAIIGLFIPMAYIFEGIIKGDKDGIKAACPHLFLLSCQVLMEGLTFYGGFSLPIRVFVPVFYNSRRVMVIVDWIREEMWKMDHGDGGGSRVYVGVGIGILNMGFWSFNLFGFLLPVYLPMAFKKYYLVNKDL